jgi:hypothetical protein
MTTTEWAENEIKLATSTPKEKQDDCFDYVDECYKSALTAYRCLADAGHSGMSWAITISILDRLTHELPLTPIIDVPEIWKDAGLYKRTKNYQCKRMFSLFKEVNVDDETITYSDQDRAIAVDLDTKSTYHGFVCNIVDELWPITMPYNPTMAKYKVYCREFDSTSKSEDSFDTVAIEYVETPEHEKVTINRYYKEGPNGFEQIEKTEYDSRLKQHTESSDLPKEGPHGFEQIEKN